MVALVALYEHTMGPPWNCGPTEAQYLLASPCLNGQSKAVKTGDFGGGWLEHLRPWLGRPVAWPLPRECRAARSRQARPEEAQEPSLGQRQGDTQAMLPHRHL